MRGRLFGVAGGAAYGTLGIFSKLFYEHGGGTFTLIVTRFCCGALVFVALAAVRSRPWPSRRVVALAALLGPAQLAATVCLLLGFEHASPGLVELLFYIYPLLVTVGAALLFRETIRSRHAVLLALGLCGIALTLGAVRSASAAGAGFGLAAGLFTATAILGGRHVMTRGLDAFQYVALAYGATGAVLAIVAAVHGISVPVNGPGLGYTAGVVIVGTVIPVLLFYSSIRLIGAPSAALLATVEPFVAVVLSFLVLDQPLTALQLLGGGLILAAVLEL